MARSVRCPQCRAVLNVPADGMERRLKCPGCQTRFYVTAFGVTRVDTEMGAGPRTGQATRPDSILLEPAGSAAEQLFRDVPPSLPSAAASRQRERSCSDCGARVPAGMSLCQACGFDLETGRRTDTLALVPEVEESPAAPAPSSRTAAGFLVGWGVLLAALAVGVLGLIGLSNNPLALVLVLIGVLGVFSAIQYHRGRAVRPLLLSLVLIGLADMAGLIILPVLAAIEARASESGLSEIDESARPAGFFDRLDTLQLSAGVVVLLAVAAGLIYVAWHEDD